MEPARPIRAYARPGMTSRRRPLTTTRPAWPLTTGYSEVLFGELFCSVALTAPGEGVSNKLWWELCPRRMLAELEGCWRGWLRELDSLLLHPPDDVPVAVAVEQIAACLGTGRVSTGASSLDAGRSAEAGREAERPVDSRSRAGELPYGCRRTGCRIRDGRSAQATGAS